MVPGSNPGGSKSAERILGKAFMESGFNSGDMKQTGGVTGGASGGSAKPRSPVFAYFEGKTNDRGCTP